MRDKEHQGDKNEDGTAAQYGRTAVHQFHTVTLLTSAMLPSAAWLGLRGTGLITPTRHDTPGEKIDCSDI